MTTKNIQDVVAEKVEMIVDLCIDQLLGGYDIRVEDPHRLQLFKDQLELKLTTTLTQLMKEVEAGERERIVQEIIEYRFVYSDNATCINMVDNLLQALTPPTSDVTEK